jgi:light-regulated signal transduction histidine kinase (bacteriophytochrome)
MLSGKVSETDGLIGRAWAECKPLYADASMSLGGDDRRLLEAVDAGTMLVIPLEATGNAWGLLLVFLKQPSLFVEDDLGLLSLFAEQTAIIFENSALVAAQQVYLRQLAVHARQLEAANKELESFSYSVSHDLRAPLRAVDGFSRILMEDFAAQLPADAVRYLQLVRNNAQQMGELIEGLLAFSRAGRQPVNKQHVIVSDLVKQVLAGLRDEQNGRSVEVSIGELPPCEADPLLLRQVFANLLTNAHKFTRKCEVARIEVGHQSIDGAGVYFVKDNGAGFDMQYAHKLFGVFQRLHRSDDYEGTGVGLAMVHNIVERHGGRIWAEAEPGKGATFFFTLSEKTTEVVEAVA